METKKLNFIIKHFGCYTSIEDENVLTSLGNASRVSKKEYWNVFSGDAEDFFDIRKTEDENELYLIFDEGIRKHVEREYITNATS